MSTSISPDETPRLSRTHLAPSGGDFDYPFADYDHARVFLTAEDFMERWNRNRRMDAAQQKDGLREMKRERALGMKFIRTNAASAANLITVDLDDEDAAGLAMDAAVDGRLPYYSYLVRNEATGHAHIGWFIQGHARSKNQQHLFDAIREAFTKILGGDPGYTGYTTRNPLVEDEQWTEWGTARTYSFSELLDFVPFEVREQVEAVRQERAQKFADGDLTLDPDSKTRNDDLFRVCGQHLRGKQGRENFLTYAHEHVAARNQEFTTPLPDWEVRDITRSITGFTLTRMAMPVSQGDSEAFKAAQRRRAARAKHVRQAPKKYSRVLEMLEAGAAAKDVGRALNIKPGAARVLISRVRAWAKEQEEATTQQGDTAPRVSDLQSHTQAALSPSQTSVTVEGITVDAATGEVLDTAEDIAEEPAMEKDILPRGVGTPVAVEAGSSSAAGEEEERDYTLGRVTVIDTTPEDWDPEVHRPIQHDPTPIDVEYPDWFVRGEKQPPRATREQQEEPVRMASRSEVRSILTRLGAA
ncbi:MAG: hypothetical protein CMH82_12680 [Nocardioides sp.]|nr:hypothetical protein [Nocardioides sp.]|tara:strand:+ start:43 stop:1623 length:1581 start_codon:yes stop_codon:yes gene_type:complete